MSRESMQALRREAAKMGVRPARSKKETIARIENAARVKGILTVRRITQEALRVLSEKLAQPAPSEFFAASGSGPLRIRLPSKPGAAA